MRYVKEAKWDLFQSPHEHNIMTSVLLVGYIRPE